MGEQKNLSAQFEANRAHLRAVAQRMLGSRSDAEDAVQEAWLRLSRADAASVDNLRAWLTTVIARVCLDMLRARASRGEAPLDNVAEERADEAIDAERDIKVPGRDWPNWGPSRRVIQRIGLSGTTEPARKIGRGPPGTSSPTSQDQGNRQARENRHRPSLAHETFTLDNLNKD